jgi:hypothetical protein
MIIQNHIESFTSMMIIKLDQHLIILEKSWMKKHDVSYHEHDDSISFYLDYCSHLEASERSFSNQSTNKKNFFPKRIFSDQSKLIENKEIKIFFEKTNNSSKIILKRSILVEFSERLIERSKRLIESQRKLNERRRIDESWRKKLKKIEISAARILSKESRKNSFFENDYSIQKKNLENESSNEESIIEIHS